jgi:hypothetical protein
LGFAVGQLQRESRIAEKCGFIRAQIICQKLGYTRVALYLENRIKGLTLATPKTHESLVALQENYSHDAISLTCRLIERKRKLKKCLNGNEEK